MTTLVTLFAVALVGLVFVLGFKMVEARVNRRLFLPEWLDKRDDDIRRYAAYAMKRSIHWGRHRVHIIARTSLLYLFKAIQHVGRRLQLRPTATLQKNGSGSVFLKQVNEHKQKVRRENGYHEE